VRLSLVVALIAGTVGGLAGYAIVKGRGTRLASFVNNLAFFPYLMPSMAFGAIYLSMFAKPNWVHSVACTELSRCWSSLGSVKYLPYRLARRHQCHAAVVWPDRRSWDHARHSVVEDA
jgi:iron(III) transport system permease protein